MWEYCEPNVDVTGIYIDTSGIGSLSMSIRVITPGIFYVWYLCIYTRIHTYVSICRYMYNLIYPVSIFFSILVHKSIDEMSKITFSSQRCYFLAPNVRKLVLLKNNWTDRWGRLVVLVARFVWVVRVVWPETERPASLLLQPRRDRQKNGERCQANGSCDRWEGKCHISSGGQSYSYKVTPLRN